MSSNDIKQKATSGMFWTAVQKYSIMAINLISGIILARLLEPEDYGIIGMLAIFMSIASISIDAGFGSALIQKKQPTQTDYSTIFYFNLGMSGVMYLILFVCAPAIAKFYHMPILCDVLRVQGVVLFINALNIIQANQLKKQLNFKSIAMAAIIASLVGLAITVYMAYNHYGVWSLVAQNITLAGVPTVMYWTITKWRPSVVFSWQSIKSLFGFGGYMFLTSILNAITGQLNGLLIGRLYNSATMGYFSKASSTESMASTSISGVVSSVAYPVYAIKQDDKNELINIIKRLTSTISFFTTPLMILLCLIAEPLFVLLYSEKWLPCVPYFQLLCLGGIAVCLHGVNNNVIAAVGKSNVMFKWTVIKRCVELCLIIAGIMLGGIKGLLIAMVINNWFIYMVNAMNVSKYIGYALTKQLWCLVPVIVVSCIAFISAFFSVALLKLPLYLDGILKIIVFVIVYVGWALLFKPEAYTYSLSIFQNFIKRKK